MGLLARLRADRAAWRALGPGGLPANDIGWLISCTLHQFALDPFETARYGPTDVAPGWLPARSGTRPTIGRHPIPHRQLDQLPPEPLQPALASLVDDVACADPARLRVATSRFERRGPAVFGPSGELAHVHAGDGSLHVVLRPGDAAAVITRGWGERHPLAGRRVLRLPDTYLLLYAPRDAGELAVVRRIVDRAVAADERDRT